MIRVCCILLGLAALSLAQNETVLLGETLTFNETTDFVHITCDTLSFMLPDVTVMTLQDEPLNRTSLSSNFTLSNFLSSNSSDLAEFDTISASDVTSDDLSSPEFNNTRQSEDAAGFDRMMEFENATGLDSATRFDSAREFDNITFAVPSNGTLFFNEGSEMMTKLTGMGFPFQMACHPEGDIIDVAVASAKNGPQIVEAMVQVFVNDTAAGVFLAPETPQDYQVDCSGTAISQAHNDPKETLEARWFNMEQANLDNGTSAVCVFSILDTDGIFWHAIRVKANDGSIVEVESTGDEEPEDEVEFLDMEDDIEMEPETTTGIMTAEASGTETTNEVLTSGETTTEISTPKTPELETTTESVTTTGPDSSTTKPEEPTFQPIEDEMGDLGEIVVDGETYDHHCINNNMIRVLVPYAGCSDFFTVVGGLPRSYQTCGLDKCFDVNECECKECSQITCEKLAPGTSQTYSITIYDTEGDQVGMVSGERTRTATGGLTESLSATGDPKSSLFPIKMK